MRENPISDKDEALRFISSQMASKVARPNFSVFACPNCSYFYAATTLLEKLVEEVPYQTTEGPADFMLGPTDWIINSVDKIRENTVLFTMHESTRFEPKAVDVLNKSKAVIFPSTWGASCANAQGVNTHLHVVPLGHDIPENLTLDQEDGYTIFATVVLTDPERKRLTELVCSFTKLLDPNIRLWIKCPPRLQMQTHDPRICYFTHWMTRTEYHNWMRQVTFALLPSSSEGFGLVHLEFSALGIPVIYCHFSALTDFMPIIPELQVSGYLENSKGRNKKQGVWFKPSNKSLLSSMEQAINIASNRDRYLQLSSYVKGATKHLTWDNTLNRLKTVLRYEGLYQ